MTYFVSSGNSATPMWAWRHRRFSDFLECFSPIFENVRWRGFDPREKQRNYSFLVAKMTFFEGKPQTNKKILPLLVIEKKLILNMKFLHDAIWIRTHDHLPGNFATTNYFNSSRSPLILGPQTTSNWNCLLRLLHHYQSLKIIWTQIPQTFYNAKKRNFQLDTFAIQAKSLSSLCTLSHHLSWIRVS